MTVVTVRPQIGEVGDALLGAIGVASDRDNGPAVATADLSGFRMASVFGVLAVVYRALVREDAGEQCGAGEEGILREAGGGDAAADFGEGG